VPGLGEGIVEKLSAAGVTTVEALADMTPEQLEAIEGIGPKTVEKISLAVNNYFASLDQGVAVEGEPGVEAEGAQESLASADEVVPEEVSGVAESASADESAGEAQTSTAKENEEQVETSEQPAPETESASETRE
jgi:transcription termination/antitermination protein NusA